MFEKNNQTIYRLKYIHHSYTLTTAVWKLSQQMYTFRNIKKINIYKMEIYNHQNHCQMKFQFFVYSFFSFNNYINYILTQHYTTPFYTIWIANIDKQNDALNVLIFQIVIINICFKYIKMIIFNVIWSDFQHLLCRLFKTSYVHSFIHKELNICYSRRPIATVVGMHFEASC